MRKLVQRYFTTEVVSNTTNKKTSVAPQARRKWALFSWSRQEITLILIAWTVRNYYFLLYVLCLAR